MRSKALMALAVAGTLTCAGAFAGGGYVGSHNSVDVQTPLSVNESAPWLTHSATLPRGSSFDTIGFQEGQFSDGPVGTSSSLSGTGSGGFDSSAAIGPSHEPISDMHMLDSGESVANVEYWLLGDESSGTGRSSGSGGSGSSGFDSVSTASPDITSMHDAGLGDHSYTTSWDDPLSFVSTLTADELMGAVGAETPLLSEHYLVYGPLAQFDGQSVIVLELGPVAEDIALLDALSREFYVLTPISEEG